MRATTPTTMSHGILHDFSNWLGNPVEPRPLRFLAAFSSPQFELPSTSYPFFRLHHAAQKAATRVAVNAAIVVRMLARPPGLPIARAEPDVVVTFNELNAIGPVTTSE